MFIRIQFIRRTLAALVAGVFVSVVPCAAQSGQAQSSTPTSPLAIHVGDADLLVGGFMDLTEITRSTDTGNGLGTSFGSIPFTTTAAGAPNLAGRLSETRFSAQNSRLTLQGTSKWGSVGVKGYIEADFLGNTSTNINVTSNSNGMRMRLYWVQVTDGKFEFFAGQSWSMMTPNRQGISPAPGDLFYSQDVDTNYQSALIWGRTPGVRFLVHPNSTVTAGLALENPEQYVGSAVVLPAAFNAAQVDTGASNLGSTSPVPNLYPDIIGKIAFDPKTGKTHQHVDAMFMVRGYKTYMASTDTKNTQTGKAGSINAVFEPVHNFKVVLNNYFSDGSGRSISNENMPDFIVNPDGTMSTVSSFAGIYGLEETVKNTLVYGYYSLARADAQTTVDANGTTPIGFGITSQSANHKVEEDTVGLTETLFRDPKIGGLQLMLQFSYVKRTPFAVPVNTPSSANTKMLYVNFRYILP